MKLADSYRRNATVSATRAAIWVSTRAACGASAVAGDRAEVARCCGFGLAAQGQKSKTAIVPPDLWVASILRTGTRSARL